MRGILSLYPGSVDLRVCNPRKPSWPIPDDGVRLVGAEAGSSRFPRRKVWSTTPVRPEREEEPRIFSSNPPGACPVPGDLLPFEVALEELKSSRKRFFLFAPSATPLIVSPERGGGPPGTGPGTETPERRGRPSWRGWDFLRRGEQGLGGAAAGAGPAEAGSRGGEGLQPGCGGPGGPSERGNGLGPCVLGWNGGGGRGCGSRSPWRSARHWCP